MLVDTHAHLNLNAFSKDRNALYKKTLDEDVSFLMPGTEINTSRKGVELAEEWNSPRVWASVGLHPIHVTPSNKKDSAELDEHESEEEEFVFGNYKKLAASNKTIAIGEIGLDYWRSPKTKAKKEAYKNKQKEVFIKQLDLALEEKLPVILHCRVAHDDMIEVLKSHPIIKTENPGVVHSYTGSKEQAEVFAEMGFCFGLNALIEKLDFLPDVVKNLPLSSIVLETDSPYLTPSEVSSERNKPVYVKRVAEIVSEIKNISYGDVADKTTKNAQKLFGVSFE